MKNIRQTLFLSIIQGYVYNFFELIAKVTIIFDTTVQLENKCKKINFLIINVNKIPKNHIVLIL